MTFDQSEFEIRCEWGEQGLAQLAPGSEVVIIVDVLSFSTCVEIALGRGALVFPCRWKDDSAKAFAVAIGAELAGGRSSNAKYSLSPRSFMQISAGSRVVLPSPNGAALTLKAGKQPTLCGCLRNARAVALVAQRFGHHIAVIPAGERWSDGSLRPAFEDWVGAGAIMHEFDRSLSPEAHAAVAAFHAAQPNLEKLLKQCGSGKELIERGFEKDVVLAAKLNVSECVPVFAEGGFIPLQT